MEYTTLNLVPEVKFEQREEYSIDISPLADAISLHRDAMTSEIAVTDIRHYAPSRFSAVFQSAFGR